MSFLTNAWQANPTSFGGTLDVNSVFPHPRFITQGTLGQSVVLMLFEDKVEFLWCGTQSEVSWVVEGIEADMMLQTNVY